jgi:hypothetical protein
VKDLIFIENMRFFGLRPQNDNVESYFVINLMFLQYIFLLFKIKL